MPSPSVILTTLLVGDSTATITVTPADFTGYTILKANFLVNDIRLAPVVIAVENVATKVVDGVTIPAIPYRSNLSAGQVIDYPLTNLVNGGITAVKLQILFKNTSTGVTSIYHSASLSLTPSGQPAAPLMPLTMPNPDDDTSFILRVLRHTNDGGSEITSIVVLLSKPFDKATGLQVNTTIEKSFSWSSMYTYSNPETKEYPEYLDLTFTAADGVTADSDYEATALFVNATSISPLSEPLMTKPRNTSNAITALVGTGSNASVTVNATSPNNTFVSRITGLVLTDQNADSTKRLAPRYYSWNGIGFIPVDGIVDFGAGFPMGISKPISWVINQLLNNVDYSFKATLYNLNGKGDDSAAFTVKAKQAPSPPTNHAVQRHEPQTVTMDMMNQQTNLDSSSRFARIVYLKFTWQDPLLNWATSSTKYTSSKISADATATAALSAQKRFILTAGPSHGINDNRTAAEKLQSNDQVMTAILQIAGSTSLVQWTAFSAGQKSTACGSSVAMVDAMTIYYNVLAFVKSQVDLAPLDIPDTVSQSQTWERIIPTVAGTSFSHSVVATITDGAALITSSASTLQAIATDNISGAKPNIVSVVAGNNDVAVILDKMTNVSGWTNVVYKFIVTDVTSGTSQTVAFTPAYDQFGDAKRTTLSLSSDLGINFTNGRSVRVSVGSMPLTDPITRNQVSFATNDYSTAVTPKGKALAPLYSTFVDKLDVKFRIQKVTPSILDGTTLQNLEFTLVKNSEMVASQIPQMTSAQITAYISTLAAGRKLSLTAAEVASGLNGTEYRNGFDYLISSADATAVPPKNFWKNLSITVADGQDYYLLARTVTTEIASVSDYSVSSLFSFYSASTAVQNLSVRNSNGSIIANYEYPSNDGGASSVGANIKNFNVELWSAGSMKNLFTTTALSYSFDSALTAIGTSYYVNVYAVSNFIDLDTGLNLKSPVATSSTIIAAKAIDMATPVVNGDGKSLVLNSNMNGSIFEFLIVLVALSDGSDKNFTVPSNRFSSNIAISATDLGITGALTIVSGMAVFTDTTANGILFKQF